MGATCTRCHRDVGCGCQLVNGLCAACRQIKTKIKDVIYTSYHLYRMH